MSLITKKRNAILSEKPNRSERSSDKEKPVCNNTYLKYLTVYNTTTGESFKPKCKSYSCPKHGWIKGKELAQAIESEIKNWDKVRFWTFTLSTKVADSPESHSKLLSKCWRYFITEIRRNTLLTKSEQELSYVKVSESHQSGYLHYHVFFSKYVHFSKIYALWVDACMKVCNSSNKISGCFVVGNRKAEVVAKYVVKYVLKESAKKLKYVNLYSVSGDVKLNMTNKPEESYAVYDSMRKLWLGLRIPRPLLVSKLEHRHKQSAEISKLSKNIQEIEFELKIQSKNYQFINHKKE